MFFKKPKLETKQEQPKSGFFSTDIFLSKAKSTIEQVLKKSIQIDPFKLKSIDQFGVTTAIAMDSGSSPMQAQKLLNSSSFGNIPEAQVMWYASQGFIGFQLCAIIAQNWLVDKACVMPAKDAIRKGYEITVNDGTKIDPALLDKLRACDKKYKLNEQMKNFVKFGRVFGIRIAMFKVDSTDPDYYLKPFNPDGVTPNSYKGIVQIDPYWITPELDINAASNPASPNFYEPTWWRVNGERIHKSHLIIWRTS